MNSFESLGLDQDIVDAVIKMGYETPSPIQETVIPHLLEKTVDVIALAQTGTGKTAAFSLPLIQILDKPQNVVRGLILSPTRELCMQIYENITKFLPSGRRFRSVAVYGGASIVPQIKDIKRGVDIIVATPGRLMDLIDRKVVDLNNIEVVILDEADEMLNMGFREDIEHILGFTPEEKKVWLFSATMSGDIRRIADKYMKEPLEVSIGRKNAVNENISHQFVVVEERHRFEALKRVVDFHPDIFGLIFCRTKMDTQEVAERLGKEGYNADSLHGDLSQQQRDRVMARFRNRDLKLLVATDVAARGIDVDEITHVIHYNLPDDAEYYTHRSGRTARKGNKGISILIANPRDLGRVTQLERISKIKFERIPVPSGMDVCQRQLMELIKRVQDTEVQEDQIATYWEDIFMPFEQMTKEEVVKKFASLEFNRFLDYYKNAPDLNKREVRERTERSVVRDTDSRESGRGHSEAVYFNIGRNDRFDIGKMVGLICNQGEIQNKFLGKIELKDEFTLVEVDHRYVRNLLEKFNKMNINGKQVVARLSEDKITREISPSKKHRNFVDQKASSGFRGRKDGKRSWR